ncbi:MAG TPA: hypothetical protein VIZ00_06390 [Streptosporangiaceae bacterium]
MASLIPGGRRRKRRDDYAAELGALQLAAMKAVMAKATEALGRNDFEAYKSLSSQVLDAGYLEPGLGREAPESLTQHERLLDGWRIVTTIVLVGGLLVVLGLVLFTKTSTSSATPFVSLVSGLAGIALGWMFAGAGKASVEKRVVARPKRGTAQDAKEGAPAPAPAPAVAPVVPTNPASTPAQA